MEVKTCDNLCTSICILYLCLFCYHLYRIFSVLSAILYLGNVTYKKKATGRDEGLDVGPPEVLDSLSQLIQVKLHFLCCI